MMTDKQRIEHLTSAIKRIATPEAFYVASSSVDPEAFARMTFAKCILDGMTLDAAEEKASYETRQRYVSKSSGSLPHQQRYSTGF